MYQDKKDKRTFRILLAAIISLGVLALGFDLYLVIAGQADANRHLPFLLPIELFLFAGLLYGIERAFERLDVLRQGRPTRPPDDRDPGT